MVLEPMVLMVMVAMVGMRALVAMAVTASLAMLPRQMGALVVQEAMVALPV